jgi:amino acid transporter
MTGELSSLFPGNSGFTSWVTASFNSPFLGYMEGFCSFVSTATNSAVYPHLFKSYLAVHVPILSDHLYGIFAMVSFICINGYINYRGLDVVSSLGIALLIFILAPFGIMVSLGAPDVNVDNWLIGMHNPPRIGSQELLSLFNVLFWNLNNWDAISTIAGEVSNPRKVIPKAMIVSLFVTTVAYVLPLAVGSGLTASDTKDWSFWQPGYFQVIAQSIAGSWLSLWVLLASAVSTVGQFQALVSSCAYQLEGMAELGWLPKVFASVSEFDTPIVGLGIAIFTALAMIPFEFLDILQYLNVVYACAQALEFAAFLNLRYYYDDVIRPFKIPLGFSGCVALMVLPFCFIASIIVLPFLSQRWDVVCVLLTTIACALISYHMLELFRKLRVCQFLRDPPRDVYEVVAFHRTPGGSISRSVSQQFTKTRLSVDNSA